MKLKLVITYPELVDIVSGLVARNHSDLANRLIAQSSAPADDGPEVAILRAGYHD